LLGEVTVAKEEVVSECRKVIEEAKFLSEDFKQASRGGTICTIDATLEACNIAVLEDCKAV
jgi:hypothetical protein